MINIDDFVDGWYAFEENYTHNHTKLTKQTCLFVKKDYNWGPTLYLIRGSGDVFYILLSREFENNICPIIRKLTKDELMIKDIIE